MTGDFTLVVNPVSGGGGGPRASIPLAKALRERGAHVEVVLSTDIEDAVAAAGRAVDRGSVVVSVGGDGMLSSLAGEVARLGGTLGIAPAGRGNDFARMLGIPQEAAAVAALLLSGRTRSVDLVCFGERVVAGSVYAGVDAFATVVIDAARWMPERLQYPYGALRSLATYTPARYRVVVDGTPHDVTAATVVVANSAYYGSGMKIAPGALVDDGLLEVVVIGAGLRRDMIRSLPKVYDGSHVDLDQVTVLRGTRVELSADGRGPVPVGGDGEQLGVLPALGEDPAVIEVRPGALRVIAPPPAVTGSWCD